MLILYVEAGSGSKTIASSLQHALLKQGVNSTVMPVHELLPKWLDKLLFASYQQWCNQEQKYHSTIYHSTWFYPALYRLIPLLLKFKGNQKLAYAKSVLSKHKHVVACSYYCAYFTRYYAKKCSLSIQIDGVLGDYTVSPGWQLPVEHLYTSHVYQDRLIIWHQKRGSNILPLGIPTLAKPSSHQRQRGHILLCGGGWGLGKGFSSLAEILALKQVTQVTVICGSNRALYQQLTKQFREAIEKKRMQLLGFTLEMPTLYQQASMVITKAGGLSLTEAAIYRCPVIVTSALPGHEESNLAVFRDSLAIWHATNTQQTITFIKKILIDSQVSLLQTSQASRLVNPLAAEHISKSLTTQLAEE